MPSCVKFFVWPCEWGANRLGLQKSVFIGVPDVPPFPREMHPSTSWFLAAPAPSNHTRETSGQNERVIAATRPIHMEMSVSSMQNGPSTSIPPLRLDEMHILHTRRPLKGRPRRRPYLFAVLVAVDRAFGFVETHGNDIGCIGIGETCGTAPSHLGQILQSFKMTPSVVFPFF